MSALADLINEKFVNPFLQGRNRIGSNPNIIVKNATLATLDNVIDYVKQIHLAAEVIGTLYSVSKNKEFITALEKKLHDNNIPKAAQKVGTTLTALLLNL